MSSHPVLTLATVAALGAGPVLGEVAAAPDQNAPPSVASSAVGVVQGVCLPLLEGASLPSVARTAGLKQDHGSWLLRIDRKQRIDLTPPDRSNPRVCSATITHEAGVQPQIRRAVNAWAQSSSPPLDPVKVAQPEAGPDDLRITSTWQGRDPRGVLGVVLSEERTLQGAPVNGDLGQTTLLVGLTPKGA